MDCKKFLIRVSTCLTLLSTMKQYSCSMSVSSPVGHKDQLPESKYTKRSPIESLEDEFFGIDISSSVHKSECPNHLEIAWHISVPGGIYASPVIGRFEDGRSRQVLLPSFKNGVLHMVDSDGHHLPGWPFTCSEKFQTAPLLHDLDTDGTPDIIWTSIDANIYFISGDASKGAQLLGSSIGLPRLKVQLKWYEGIDSENVDASMSLQEEGGEEIEKDGSFEETLVYSKRRLLQEDAYDRDEDSVDTGSEEAGKDTMSPYYGMTPEAQKSTIQLSSWLSHYDEIERLAGTSATSSNKTNGARAPKQKVRIEIEDNHFVFVDPHVLGNPVLADLDFDGFDDLLVVPVSYYFDQYFYRAHPDLTNHLPLDFDMRNYVAAGLVALSLKTRQVVWHKHLDLTTAKTELKAMIYSAPTVCDVDLDGRLDVLIGTRLGFVYRLDAQTGEIHKEFPLIMGDIQAQLTAADLVGDEKLEILVVDANGNAALFDSQGTEIWSTVTTGFATQAPAIGDVDGDGKPDVVFGLANSPFLWALDADTGKPLDKFPIRIGDRVIAPVTLVDLSPSTKKQKQARSERLSIVFPAFDGFLYVVDGATGCTSKFDLGGEESYTMALVDDILGHGKLDILISTFQGSVFCLTSEHVFSPLAAFTTQFSRHGPISRHAGTLPFSVHFDKRTRERELFTGTDIPLGYIIHK